MIGAIRKRLGKRAYDVIVGMTIVALLSSMFVTGLLRRFSNVPDNIIGDVNGYTISRSEYQRALGMERQRLHMVQQYYGLNEDLLKHLGAPEENAFKSVVREKLLLGVADRMGLELSPEYVRSKLDEPFFIMQSLSDIVPSSVWSGRSVDYSKLMKLLQRQGINAACLESVLEARIKGQLVKDLAGAALYIPSPMIDDEFKRMYGAKKFLVMRVPASYYKNGIHKEKVTDAVLSAFMAEANKRNKHYWSAEKRTGIVWTVSIPANLSEQERTARIKEAEGIAREGQRGVEMFVKEHKGIKSPVGPTEKKNEPIIEKLFSLSLGSFGVVTTKDKIFIVELSHISESKEQPLSSIRERVLEDYSKSEIGHKLAEDLATLKKLQGRERSEWLKEHKGTERTTEFLDPENSSAWQEFEKEGILPARIKHLYPVGSRITALTSDAGYLIELLDVKVVSDKNLESKRRVLEEQLTRQQAPLLEASFVASLEKSGKIKKNKSFFDRITVK